MKKRNSKGFAHIAIVLVVLVIGVIGASAVYIKNRNDTKKCGDGCMANTFRTKTITEASVLESYELKDIGLKINPGQFTDLTMYRTELEETTSSQGTFRSMSVTFSTKALEAASGYSPDCTATAGALGSIGLSTSENGNKKVEGTDWRFVIYKSFSNRECLKLPGAKSVLDEITTKFVNSVTIEKL